MKVSDFDYDLPQELIAQHPLPDRNRSRMMVVDRTTGDISHTHFRCLIDQLCPDDLLVLNTSRVIPARLWGRVGEREVEFLLLQEVRKSQWETLCRPAKRVKKGERVHFSPLLTAEVTGRGSGGRRFLQFSRDDIRQELEKIGFAPLPPYIKRRRKDFRARPADLERYQTVYAREGESIAAPTAGLHFIPQTLEDIKDKGIEVAEISLDVGWATFQPVRVDRTQDHTMLEETYTIPPEASEQINKAKTEKRPVVAVGTTTMRALESAWKNDGVREGGRSTRLFISPGFKFRVVDRLLTNFHLPRSTLLMLVSAFAGLELIRSAYEKAVVQKYRFYSYGDCMFIK